MNGKVYTMNKAVNRQLQIIFGNVVKLLIANGDELQDPANPPAQLNVSVFIHSLLVAPFLSKRQAFLLCSLLPASSFLSPARIAIARHLKVPLTPLWRTFCPLEANANAGWTLV